MFFQNKDGYITADKTPNPFAEFGQTTRYATLSWGLFDEMHEKVDTIQYFHASLNTKAEKIIDFMPIETADYYKVDPVVFALSVDPLARSYPFYTPYNYAGNNPIRYTDLDGKQIFDPMWEFLKGRAKAAISRATEAAVEVAVDVTVGAIHELEETVNPVKIYERITDPNSELKAHEAASLAKYSDEAISAGRFLESIKGYSAEEIKTQAGEMGFFSSQDMGPVNRYVKDPANPSRIIDMRHFLVVGNLGEKIGLAIEVGQSSLNEPSGFDLQDFFSNALGADFYDNFYDANSKQSFAEQLKVYFENRAGEPIQADLNVDTSTNASNKTNDPSGTGSTSSSSSSNQASGISGSSGTSGSSSKKAKK